MDEPQNIFATSDLYYAAYLKVAGVPLLGSEWVKGRVVFKFEASDGLQDLKAQYFNRTARVPALSYADEIKAMKVLTHFQDR